MEIPSQVQVPFHRRGNVNIILSLSKSSCEILVAQSDHRVVQSWELRNPNIRSCAILGVAQSVESNCAILVAQSGEVSESDFILEGPGSTANNAGFEDLTIGILHFWHLGFPGNSSIICVLMFFFCGLYILLYMLSSNAFVHFGLVKCKLVILRCRFHCK